MVLGYRLHGHWQFIRLILKFPAVLPVLKLPFHNHEQRSVQVLHASKSRKASVGDGG